MDHFQNRQKKNTGDTEEKIGLMHQKFISQWFLITPMNEKKKQQKNKKPITITDLFVLLKHLKI